METAVQCFGRGGGLEGAGPILCYSQSGDNPQEDLAKFDY
jgi:hypothetical protein